MVIDQRWRTALAVAPYVVLAILAAFAVGAEWGEWFRLWPELALLAAMTAWIVVFRSLRFRWADRADAIAVFLAGAVVLNLLLVLREGWYGFLTIATFTFAFSLPAWPWELLAVGGTALVAGMAQSSSLPRTTAIGLAGTIVVIVLNVTVMCGMSWGLQLASRLTERTGAEAERARLAREIHDTLAQGFAGIITQLQAAEQAPDDAARRGHTEAAIGLARDGLAEARRSVAALRPPALDDTRLPEAIDAVARRWAARTGIPVDVRLEGGIHGLRTDVEVALLRTTQEALANVERHAAASHVHVVLRGDGDRVRLEVRDDGHGFDPSGTVPADPDGGFGLISMRERVEALAGRLDIESRQGRGTAVRAEVPA